VLLNRRARDSRDGTANCLPAAQMVRRSSAATRKKDDLAKFRMRAFLRTIARACRPEPAQDLQQLVIDLQPLSPDNQPESFEV
jgi:hypothetical protein